MEIVPKADVAEAVRLAMAAALQNKTGPRLSVSEQAALVALYMVTLVIDLDHESAQIKDLLTKDSVACREDLDAALKRVTEIQEKPSYDHLSSFHHLSRRTGF